MTSSAKRDPAPLKDYFHHAIPRFILREFLTGPVPVFTTRRQRERSLSRGHKKGRECKFENIYVYDLSSTTLRTRCLSRVYGQTNLYRDGNNTADVDYIETRFSRLEQETSQVIKSIRTGLVYRAFTLSRAELATLRKFIFLMHFRSAAVSSTYYRESDPHNAPLVEWIRKYKETRGLTTETDIWRDALKYYLDTPHQDIVATGERIRERYGNHRLHEMLRDRVDPDLEEWYAIDYENQANYFFLGVWEAAEDSEFVLSSNAFGLWEGLIYGSPGAHRVYVVSPRIVIILRRTFLRRPHSNDPSILHSCLANIPIAKPTIKHTNEDLFAREEDTDPSVFLDLVNAYRSSPDAQKDEFTFSITRLTAAETYAVNEVIMMNANLHPSASLTFASPDMMLKTLQTYDSSHNAFMAGKKHLFIPLLRALHTMKQDSLSHLQSSPPSPLNLDLSTSETDTDTDLQLHMFLRFTIGKNITFPSSYNRAYVVFHMATDAPSLGNPISTKIRRMLDGGIMRLRRLLDPPLQPIFPHSHSGRRKLVETLSKADSEVFFALIGYQVDQTGIGSHSNDILANVIYEAATLGITHWLAERRPDVIEDLLSPWVNLFDSE
ncbi:hypothetical protein BDN70DRAFT_886139 [Pholiota conissans]|uniref:Uncharacterized protein n=1 Tax=Pholiota conissans TaxID=109636 RepID=A0A9P5YPQ6_9AGAR|nr:hypothetical protein BDN70DRAFT_886139 [Pholiota conissans]